MKRFWTAVIVLALLGSACGSRDRRDYAADEERDSVTQNAPNGETAGGGGQTIAKGSSGSAAGPSISRSSSGTRRPSTHSLSEEELSQETIPQDANSAGPPVFYTDQADDAYGGESWTTRQTPPDATVSQKAFDILRVDWAPVSHGYSTSITVAGTASDDGSYVSYGYFFPRGEACRIYYFLTPGMTAYAHAFCESSGDEWGLVGVVEGSKVTSTPTPAGGTQLAATFDNRAIPPLLETAGRKLHNLSAFTCEEIDDRYAGDSRHGLYCGQYGVLDTATSTLNYRV